MVALLDMIISMVLYYHLADATLIAILQPVFLMLIGGIAYEDGAAKGAPQNVQAGTYNEAPQKKSSMEGEGGSASSLI